jgi:uncharacterized protein (TIGR04255 family)
MRGEFHFSQLAKGNANVKNVQVDGYRALSSDGLRIAQFRLDGFTFNQLRPYPNWEEFQDEAKRMWEKYLEAASPVAIDRVAVRYINEIKLAGDREQIGNYITAAPIIPEDVSQLVSRFVYQVTVHYPEDQVSANITQAFEPTEVRGEFNFILDIDVYEAGTIEESQLVGKLAKLRSVKNTIFKSYLTDALLRSFE